MILKMLEDSYTPHARTLIDGESRCIESCTLENGVNLSFVGGYWRDNKDNRYTEVDIEGGKGFSLLPPENNE